MKKNDEKILKIVEQTEKVENFIDLLDSLDLEDKKKKLWIEAYRNAVSDRKRAELLYDNLYPKITEDPSNHSILGMNMAKYLERMEKSNTQILKLIELIQKETEKQESLNPEDIFSKIGNN